MDFSISPSTDLSTAISPSALLREEFPEQIHLSRRARRRLAQFDPISLSDHTEIRVRQRGISELQIALMLLFGSSSPAGAAERSFALDQASRQALQRALGDQYARVCDRLDYYVIVNPTSKCVITCCHRLKRPKR
ncbi:MAG: hypothetical protein J4G19_05635 [Pseudomonadales bacterium]|nr:hypothetical protein [Pseudomonadales bacterium]